MIRPLYTNTVTHIEADWANLVTTLAYDIFKESVTVEDALKALGIGSLALQNVASVSITGGTIKGVAISSSSIELSTGTIENTPASDNGIVNVKHLREGLTLATRNLDLKSMSRQAANTVNITGGSGKFTLLQVASDPSDDADVVNMRTLRDAIERVAGGSSNLSLQTRSPAERVSSTEYLLPFIVPEGKTMICFVGGIYVFPDQCSLNALRNGIVFNVPIPEELDVGGVFV